MRDKRLNLILLAVVAIALILAVFGPSLTDKKRNLPEYTPAAQSIKGIAAKGTVESSQEVMVSSQVKGVVSKVFVAAGDTVEKGQLLLEFDTSRIRAQLLQSKASVSAAQARLAGVDAGFREEDVSMAQQSSKRSETVYLEARDEYERLKRLLVRDAVTLNEVNRARERFNIAESQFKESDANLKKHRSGSRINEIRQAKAEFERAVADRQYVESIAKDYRVHAPISGVVAARHRDAGESTDIEAPLFKLINPALSRIRAELEETEVGKVKDGQQAEVIADAYPEKSFSGIVTKVFPIVQKKTQKSFDPMATFDINTQEIHIKLQDNSALKNGMTVTVRFK